MLNRSSERPTGNIVSGKRPRDKWTGEDKELGHETAQVKRVEGSPDDGNEVRRAPEYPDSNAATGDSGVVRNE